MKDKLVFDTTAIADSDSVGAYLRDAAGNLITSQANGSQRALDVGINVAGVQIDPRSIRVLTAADVVTAQQGTSPWVTKDQADGPVAPGTAAAFSQLAGAVYNSAGVTLTTGQQAALQLDAAGALKVNLVSPISVATDLNGIYNVSTNALPDNVGIIGSSRAAAGLANQTLQFTGGSVASDAVATTNIVAQDTNAFNMLYNGTTWDRMTGTSGNLNVNIASSSASITVSDAALANTAISSNTKTLATAGTAQAVVTAALTNRKYLSVYNFSNKQIYIGGASVTAANGFPVSPGSYLELRAGAASPVNFVGQTGATPEIRTLELS